MKITRIVELARVRLGDMDENDTCCLTTDDTWTCPASSLRSLGYAPDVIVRAKDTKKYPPRSETYTVDGIPENEMQIVSDHFFLYVVMNGPASEIETVYK